MLKPVLKQKKTVQISEEKNSVHISEGGEVCIDAIRAFKFYDHMRMKHKIKQLTPLINPILNYEHRKKVFIDRGYDKIELNSLSEVV